MTGAVDLDQAAPPPPPTPTKWWHIFMRPRRPGPRTVPVENVRARIAYILLGIFAATIGLTFGAAAGHWAGTNDIRQFEAPIISAEVSLLGAVMGFYYASRKELPELGPPVNPEKTGKPVP